MLINNLDASSVETTDELESIDFSLDTDSMNMLFKGFSDSLYSNKIGSIVREITSNCFDSHIEAGVIKDVEIEFSTGTNGQRVITFRDFGVGISPERVKNVYSKYFSSTKRNTNDQIGGFGLGSKTPLSYTPMFTVCTKVDGIQYTYLIHRGSGAPVIKILDTCPTEESNGTEIIIPIKDFTDEARFILELETQLRYFDSVRIIGCDRFTNDYQIFRGKHFLYRPGCTESRIHIALGKVTYPLDYTQLNLYWADYQVPVALRFEVGDLTVTMNREALEYTDDVKDKIAKKLKDCKQELQDIANSYSTVYTSLEEALKVSIAPGVRLDETVFIPTGEFVSIPYPIYDKFQNFMKNPLESYNIFGSVIFIADRLDYTGRVIKKGRSRRHRSSVSINTINNDRLKKSILGKDVPIYRLTGALAKRKSIYIAEQENIPMNESIALISTQEFDTTRNFFPGLSLDEVTIVRKELLKLIVAKTKSYDKTEIPKEWMDEYLKNMRAEAAKVSRKIVDRDYSQIHLRKLRLYAGNPSFAIYERRVHDLKMEKCIIVYCTYSEVDKLIKLARVLECGYDSTLDYKVQLYKVSEETAKKIKGFAVHVDEFKEKHSNLVRRIVTAYKAEQEVNKLRAIRKNMTYTFLSEVKKIDAILNFVNSTLRGRFYDNKELKEWVDAMPDADYLMTCSKDIYIGLGPNSTIKPFFVMEELRRLNKLIDRAPLLTFLNRVEECDQQYKEIIEKYLIKQSVNFKSKLLCYKNSTQLEVVIQSLFTTTE